MLTYECTILMKYNVSYRTNWFGGEAVFLQSLKLCVLYVKLPTQYLIRMEIFK